VINQKKVFVIIPSLISTGPVKGAIALCNEMSNYINVTLIVLKPFYSDAIEINKRVNVVKIGDINGWRLKRKYIIKLVLDCGGKESVSILSSCLSADLFCISLKRYAYISCSVRANLPLNYYYEFGLFGIFIAYSHMLLMHLFSNVVAMSVEMSEQLRKVGLRKVSIIGNFVDEEYLERYRVTVEKNSDFRFVYLASLTNRKRPELLIQSIYELSSKGVNCYLDVIGTGPLETQLKKMVEDKNLTENVIFHGQLSNPYGILQKSDCLVLPSESEGISRAVLEALYFGVPCVLRDVDANSTLVVKGESGELFEHDNDFIDVLYDMVLGNSAKRSNKNFIPSYYKQKENVLKYLELLS